MPIRSFLKSKFKTPTHPSERIVLLAHSSSAPSRSSRNVDIEAAVPVQQSKIFKLPNEIFVHIGKFCNWSSRRALTEVCLRFYAVYAPMRNQMWSIKVGNIEADDLITFIDIEPDMKTKVRYAFLENSHKVTKIVKNGETTEIKCENMDGMTYGIQLFKRIISKNTFEKIEIRVLKEDFLENCLSYKGPRGCQLWVPNRHTSMKVAERLQPSYLEILRCSECDPKLCFNEVDISKLPNLRHLSLQSTSVDFEKILHSQIRHFHTISSDQKFTKENVEKLTEMFMNGTTRVRTLRIMQFGSRTAGVAKKQEGAISDYVRNEKGQTAIRMVWDSQLVFEVDDWRNERPLFRRKRRSRRPWCTLLVWAFVIAIKVFLLVMYFFG